MSRQDMTKLLCSIIMFPFKFVALFSFLLGILGRKQYRTLLRAKSSFREIPIKGSDFPDTFSFIPYTFCGSAKELMDPINIIYEGLNAIEFAKMVIEQKPGWRRIYKSYQFVFAQDSWQISHVQIVKKVPEHPNYVGVRYHVRLFSFVSDQGVSVTLGAAHYEHRKDGHKIISWDDARDEVIRAFGLHPSMCTYIPEISKPNWRGHPSDGRAVFLRVAS